MLKHVVTDYSPTALVGGVFRKGGINLIYGESGIGKTVSTIRSLNKEGIVPILLDYDNNDSPSTNKCDYLHINGRAFLHDKDATIPTDKVIIVDTWVSYQSNYYGSREGAPIEFLESLKSEGNTIIIVAHNKGIATKKDIPDMDEHIVNHLSAKLFMEYVPGKTTAKLKTSESVDVIVMKCRGYSGPRRITNWMR